MRIFISAVTSQFKACRDAIARDLRATGADVKVQEDFTQGPGTLLEKMEAYIGDCGRVVVLIGSQFGFEPPAGVMQDGAQRRSYTQWEYFFAIGERLDGSRVSRKDVYAYFASDEYLAGHPVDQSSEDAELQRQFIETVAKSGKDRQRFSSLHELRALVLRDGFAVQNAGYKPCNLPYASIGALFKGRDAFLERIRDTFGAVTHTGHRRAAAITASAHTAALYGLGGIGKTRAAVEFAHAEQDSLTALLFVRADSPENLQTNLANLCGAAVLDLPEREAKETEVRTAAALSWLESHPGWLLIFDNVDTEDAARAVEALLARLSAHGQVMITSRLSRWPDGVESLALDLLTVEDSVDYLLTAARNRRKSESEKDDTRRLAETLGQLPLALAQAAAYINEQRLTFARYLDEWNRRHDDVLKWFDERQMKYPMSVAVTWQTAFSQLREPAKELLQVLAWFAADPIPETLLDISILAVAQAREVTAATLRGALADLERYSLVTRADGTPVFSVHRLVQDVTRCGMATEERTLSQTRALTWLDTAFQGDPQDVQCWPTLDALGPHVATATLQATDAVTTEVVSRMLNRCGQLLTNKAQYRTAEPMLRHALAAAEATFGTSHSEIASILNNLASLLHETNRISEAEPMFRRALAIEELNLGTEHPNVAMYLNNLALLLYDTNRLAEAESVFRRVLAIDQASHGADRQYVASYLNNLARLLQVTNRFAEAEPMFRRALAIDEVSYGLAHPTVANRLNNLAHLLNATGRFEEAEPLNRRALAIYEESYGADHPLVAMSLSNLGRLLSDTNRSVEAEPLLRRALAIDEVSLGPHHPNVAIRLNNLALLMQNTKRLSEAEPLFRRALAILANSSTETGYRHPFLGTAISRYENIMKANGRTDEQADAEIRVLTEPVVHVVEN